MGFSNCAGCWDSPCLCGKGYEHLKLEDLNSLTGILMKMCVKKEKKKQSECSHTNIKPIYLDFALRGINGYECHDCRKEFKERP